MTELVTRISTAMHKHLIQLN